MKNSMFAIVLGCALVVTFAGCKKDEPQKPAPTSAAKPAGAQKPAAKDTHTHADGSTHDDHGSENEGADGHDHAHDEVDLEPAKIGDMKVELAQGHGKVEAGKEGHLVVKLPYNDKGATIVRAWIGTEDRLKSVVGKGEYAPSHDDYDIHATAPKPLPEGTMWWIEIQKPDGTKIVGSAKPIM